jgi:hypothetical protein
MEFRPRPREPLPALGLSPHLTCQHFGGAAVWSSSRRLHVLFFPRLSSRQSASLSATSPFSTCILLLYRSILQSRESTLRYRFVAFFGVLVARFHFPNDVARSPVEEVVVGLGSPTTSRFTRGSRRRLRDADLFLEVVEEDCVAWMTGAVFGEEFWRRRKWCGGRRGDCDWNCGVE